MPESATFRRSVAVAVGAFVALGLSESGLGTAWPSIRADLDRPISDLGTLLALGVVSYGMTSLVSGAVITRLGTGRTLVAAAGLSATGLGLYATAGTWGVALGAAMTLGVGGGLLDSGLNAHAAHTFTPGAMNLLHAGYGVGATLGPLVVVGAVVSDAGWQTAYLVFAAVEAVLLGVLLVVRNRWEHTDEGTVATGRLRLDAVVVLSLAMFFLYTGVEVAAGQWSYSALTEGRGFTAGSAGAWVAAYWGGLTVGRLGLSAIATRLGPSRVLGWSMAGAVTGTGLFWWDPLGLGALALPLTGLSLAGVFPTLVTLTPRRIGPDRTTHMVGYQLAAASVGAAALPWLIGRAIDRTSLEALGPALVVATAAMVVTHLALEARVRAR